MLHIGGVRTALYAYLLAKQTGGEFVLRVEDTDRSREVEGATESILRALNWVGIAPDEGVVLEDGKVGQRGNKGSYIQSERQALYQQHAQILLDSGHAYYAFDTKEELETMRETMRSNSNPSPKYDSSVRMNMRNSLSLPEDEVKKLLADNTPYVVRLKVDPNRDIEVHDEVRGKLTFQGHTIDDTVLLKADGFPTYHLAVVVDDHHMELDICIRGEEWLSSLPKHVLIYEAFGWEPSKFAHLPLMLNPDRSKLSKRQGDVAATDYIDKGYLPEAMINFMVQQGWNDGTEQDIFTMEELIKKFSLDRVQKGGAVFDRERLDWVQGQWMRKFSIEEFVDRIKPLVVADYPASAEDNDFATKAALIQDRITFLNEAPQMLSYYYGDVQAPMDIVCHKKQKVTAENIGAITADLIATLDVIDEADWNETSLSADLNAMAETKEYRRGQVFWPLRAILTGLPFSPGAYEVAVALGKEVTMKRLCDFNDQL
jgi:glutamyl-tRNA synthetase